MRLTIFAISLAVLSTQPKSLLITSDEEKHRSASKTASCTSGTKRCVFPFVFNSRIITSCTTIDGDATPWCATKVTEEKSVKEWAYCEDDCPGVEPVEMFVHPENAVGRCGKIYFFAKFITIFDQKFVVYQMNLEQQRLLEGMRLKQENIPGRFYRLRSLQH